MSVAIAELSPVNGRIEAAPGVLLTLNRGLTHQFDYGEWRAAVQSIEERFWAKVQPTGFCWEWTGSKTRGYGSFSYLKGNRRSHRIAYELLVGPIPKGLVLDHLCRNTSCVNPDHLEPVTQAENVRRGFHAAVRVFDLQTHCSHGHVRTPENTVVSSKGYKMCRECDRLSKTKIRRCVICGNSVQSRNLAKHVRTQHSSEIRAAVGVETDTGEGKQ